MPAACPLKTIRRLRNVFARQGAIVASWRTYNGRKLGPYYRLTYRVDGRQCSLYLGKSKNLLRQVRRLLDKLQNYAKTRRVLRQVKQAAQKNLRNHLAQFRIEMLRIGLQPHGYDARGWRRFLALHNIRIPLRGAGVLRQLSVRIPRHGLFADYTNNERVHPGTAGFLGENSQRTRMSRPNINNSFAASFHPSNNGTFTKNLPVDPSG
jgi:hypothetical protein